MLVFVLPVVGVVSRRACTDALGAAVSDAESDDAALSYVDSTTYSTEDEHSL